MYQNYWNLFFEDDFFFGKKSFFEDLDIFCNSSVSKNIIKIRSGIYNIQLNITLAKAFTIAHISMLVNVSTSFCLFLIWYIIEYAITHIMFFFLSILHLPLLILSPKTTTKCKLFSLFKLIFC